MYCLTSHISILMSIFMYCLMSHISHLKSIS